MKLIHFFVDVFCVITFLTLGSLMMIVSFHILPMEDALIKVQALYESSSESLQLGILGILLIAIGLFLSKKIVKQSRRGESFFSVESDVGRITIAYSAIDELVGKVLGKYDVVKNFSVNSAFNRVRLDIQISIEIVSGWDLGELTQGIKRDVEDRVSKMLRCQLPIIININVSRLDNETLELVGR